MRRRRINRGTWLPVLGTEFTEGEPLLSFDRLVQFSNVGEPTQGPFDRIGLDILPLTYDFTPTQDQAALEAGVSLRDLVEGQEFLLDRVVGKVYCGIQNKTNAALVNVLCCAALAVFPVDDATQASSLEADDMDPLIAQNSQQPWLWRRTWMLTNWQGSSEPFTYYGESNNLRSSVLDGPHLDTKGTKRRIRKEQRIFLVLTTRAITYSRAENVVDNGVEWIYDLRLFGKMMRAKNKSTFK